MKPVEKDLKIHGQQIYLRPIAIADTDDIVRWRNEKKSG